MIDPKTTWEVGDTLAVTNGTNFNPVMIGCKAFGGSGNGFRFMPGDVVVIDCKTFYNSEAEIEADEPIIVG